MSAVPVVRVDDADEIGWEIADLVATYGSERAALRAALIHINEIEAAADRSVSRGYLRGRFSEGARPLPADDEP